MLQHSTPEDFIIATGVTYSVRRLVEEAFLPPRWTWFVG